MESERWQDPPEYRGGGPGLVMPGITPAVKVLLILNVAAFLLTDVVGWKVDTFLYWSNAAS